MGGLLFHVLFFTMAIASFEKSRVSSWISSRRNHQDVNDSMPFDANEEFIAENGECALLLTIAIMENFSSSVQWLLEHGADPNKKIVCASKSSLKKRVWQSISLLENRGLSFLTKRFGRYPLGLAIEMDNSELVDLLTRHQADVNQPFYIHDGAFVHEVCPLAAAAKKQNLDIVRILLDRGADVNCSVCRVNLKTLWLPIRQVLIFMLGLLALLLISNPRCIFSHDSRIFVATVLIVLVVWFGFQSQTCLVDLDSAISPQSFPLAVAVQSSNADVAKLLLLHNASVNVKLIGRSTLLAMAIKTRNLKITRLILENGADVESPTDSLLHVNVTVILSVSQSLLYSLVVAWIFGRRAIIRWILLLGFWIIFFLVCAMFLDSKNFPMTKTHLALAIEAKDTKLLMLLKEFGADFNRKIFNQWKPSEYAKLLKVGQ